MNKKCFQHRLSASAYFLILVVGLSAPAAANAQTISGIRTEPASAQVGETVKVIVDFNVEGPINCGIRLHFADGSSFVDYKINQKKDVPLVVQRAYQQPGEFRLVVEPKTVGVLGRCFGKTQTALLKVGGTGSSSMVASVSASLDTRPLAQRVAEAKSTSEALSEQTKNSTNRLFTSAFATYKEGDFANAKRIFEKGLAIHPAHGIARYYLAETLVQLNDRRGARQHYEMAAALIPGTPEGRQAQEELNR